ncbi:MAG: chitobiase/beta-hexosaminidase C-terminal domain-containing protein [Leptospiraceae bacterium]|nr:chitobiase/beta-hexosaminidase C-terminal domain-containing protein [Leptospiraceae bacterium]
MNSIIKMDKFKPQRSRRREVGANSILAFVLLIGILFGNGCFHKVDNAANLGFASYVLRILGAGKNQNVETPTFTPPAGNYTTDQTIALSTTTVGATIYYTLDGTNPTYSSTVYTGIIPVAGNGITKMIKAIAVKSGMVDSASGNSELYNQLWSSSYSYI